MLVIKNDVDRDILELIVKKVEKKDAINTQDNDGNTPLHLAVTPKNNGFIKNDKLIKFLVENGIDL